jgi:2-polyprenyl-3-methyl-5-hydroxy-6-metoxy-1,4-benzoquinol methylase
MTDFNKMNASITLEKVSCPLGCPENEEAVLTGRDLLHNLPGEYTVVKCLDCGLMRTNPRPTPETMGFYYPNDYGPYLGTRVKPVVSQSTTILKKWLRLLAQRIFKFNTEVLPLIPTGRMLEVGCASGSFLHHMGQQGWQVEGIEFSEQAAGMARQMGYPVYAGSLETAPNPDQSFDLIVGWMVLEHLHNPMQGLIKLHEWAKPHAYLVLSVPNAGAWNFRIFKEKWYALQVPNHLYHYTPASLTRILFASGWEVEKIFHQRILTEWIASTGYMLTEVSHFRITISSYKQPRIWRILVKAY